MKHLALLTLFAWLLSIVFVTTTAGATYYVAQTHPAVEELYYNHQLELHGQAGRVLFADRSVGDYRLRPTSRKVAEVFGIRYPAVRMESVLWMPSSNTN